MKHAERIGFLADVSPMVGDDVVFVECALADSGHKAFPDAGTAARLAADEIACPSR